MARARLLHVLPTMERGGVQLRLRDILESVGDEFDHQVVTLDGTESCSHDLLSATSCRRLPALPKRGSWSTVRRLRSVS